MFSEEIIKSHKMPELKTIDFHGIKITTELWIYFVAMDEYGNIYGFNCRPHFLPDCWATIAGVCVSLGKVDVDKFDKWKDTLIRVS